MAKPNHDLLHYRPRSPDLSSLPLHQSGSSSIPPRHSFSGHRLSDSSFHHHTSPSAQAPTSAPHLFSRNNSISGASPSPHQRYFPPDFGMPPQTRSQRAAQEETQRSNVAHRRRTSLDSPKSPLRVRDFVKESQVAPDSPGQNSSHHIRAHSQFEPGSRPSIASLPPFEANSTISAPCNLNFQHQHTSSPFHHTPLPPLQSINLESHREHNLSPTSNPHASPSRASPLPPPAAASTSADPASAISPNPTPKPDPSSVANVSSDHSLDIKTKFPVARIKRIMQADEDVGKVAQGTPVAVSKALELFMVSLITKASQAAAERCTKRITASHLKSAIEKDDMLDFLDDIISKVPDQPTRADDGEEDERRKRKGGRKKKEESDD